MNVIKHPIFIAFLIVVIVSVICSGESNPWPTHGWSVSTPEEQGMNSGKLAAMIDFINSGKEPVDGIAVVRHGRLVLESYRYPMTSESKHVVNSCTKSVISALFGIALGEGRIKGLDQKISDILPASRYEMGQGMADVTLRQLLTMSSGMEWLEVPNSLSADEMYRSKDWVSYILQSDIVADPGSRFNYNSGGAHLLSAVLTKATGKSALDYGREKLFSPLGITNLEWEHDPQGNNNGGWGLKMRTADMAKLGYLYLNRGLWEGKTIIPSAWVEESTRKHMETPGSIGVNGYGYMWWMTEYGGYYAMGSNGQYIFVIPDKDLVVAFTSSLLINGQLPETMMKKYILPSIQSDASLDPNPKGTENLKRSIVMMGERS